MATEGRIMGLDVGEVRTGVALSDPLGIIAQAHSTVEAAPPDKAVEAIRILAEEQAVVRIVAGVPLDQNGRHGPQAAKVMAFVEKLRAAVTVEVCTVDERFTTAAAERALLQAGVRRKGRKKVIDKLAAQQILQTYLDRQARERSRPAE